MLNCKESIPNISPQKLYYLQPCEATTLAIKKVIFAGQPDEALTRFLLESLSGNGIQLQQLSSLKELPTQLETVNSRLILMENSAANRDALGRTHLQLQQHNIAVMVVLNRECLKEKHLTQLTQYGVEDFLYLPINPKILVTKIQAVLNYRQMQSDQNRFIRNCNLYQQQVKQEKLVTKNLYDKILSANYLDTPVVKSKISDNSLYNGDIVLVGRTPDNHLHVMLGDFSGFGLSALVASAPIADIFYSMTEKGFSINAMIEEMNKKLLKLLPTDMFLAAILVSIDPKSKSLTLVNCGMPENYLVNRQSGEIKTIFSDNLPLGIDQSLTPEIQKFDLNGHDYLYLLAGNLYKIPNNKGESLSCAQVVEWISAHTDTSAFETFLQHLETHFENENTLKQLVFAEVFCDVENIPWQDDKKEHSAHSTEVATPWKTMIELDIDTLRKLNPVPVIVNSIMEIQGLADHQQSIFMIVTELFANALDHGILGLESSMKETPEGFMQYYEQREQRLQTQNSGKIRIFFKHIPTDTGGELTIRVKDSGDGFDYRDESVDLDTNSGFSGRGRALLKSLCKELTYHGNGNQVTAVYDWQYQQS